MSLPFIFFACGQYTEAEKSLGKNIVKLVKTVGGMDAFFAEDVQDLNSLDSNILGALHDCAGFITVMHPRGRIVRPDGTEHVRASVWIEQELAVATYIHRVEGRSLPVIAFRHESVGLEGIRDLLHLNPIKFTDESEILEALSERLLQWKSLSPTGIRVELQSGIRIQRQDHWIRPLKVYLVNESSQRITEFDGKIRVPTGILKHWSSNYDGEDKSDDARYRCFRLSETNRGPVQPHETRTLYSLEYCTQCAVEDAGGVPALVSQATVEATVWIDGREYKERKTIQQLAEDAEARGQA